MTGFDWAEHACPLPVFRVDGDTDEVGVEPCGEALFTGYEETRYLLKGGEADGSGVTWRVECGAGHVLVVPDHGADDNYWRIPFDGRRVEDALNQIRYGPDPA